MSEAQAREGVAQVPGARLRYRLAGTPGAPLLLFENGWGASYEMWTWVERELAPHVQLLFYNRGGIGGSELLQPQSVAGLSAQFAALPAAAGVAGPVTVVGQSYGGLMCALHAAQRPEALRGAVEIDPTPDLTDPEIDGPLRHFPKVIRLAQWGRRLGLPDLVFRELVNSLPQKEGRAMLHWSLANPRSLDAGLAELALRFDIRAAIAAAPAAGVPRLLLGAGRMPSFTGLLARVLSNPERARASFEHSKQMQRERPQRDAHCRVLMLPHTHAGLVFDRDGAAATAAAVLNFVRGLRH